MDQPSKEWKHLLDPWCWLQKLCKIWVISKEDRTLQAPGGAPWTRSPHRTIILCIVPQIVLFNCILYWLDCHKGDSSGCTLGWFYWVKNCRDIRLCVLFNLVSNRILVISVEMHRVTPPYRMAMRWVTIYCVYNPTMHCNLTHEA